MKKKTIGFLSFAATLALTGGLVACGGEEPKDPNNGKEEEQVYVMNTTLHSLPDKTTYYLNESFDITGGEISVNYSDGTSVVIDMTTEMFTAPILETYGEHELILQFEYEGEQYSLKFYYTVSYSEAVTAFLALSDSLPALNKVTTEDAEDILTALDAYEALKTKDDQAEEEQDKPSDREIVDTYFEQAIRKVRLLETRVLVSLQELYKAEADVYFETLNIGDYSDDNLAMVENYFQVFRQTSFASVREIMSAKEKLYQDILAVDRLSDDPNYTVDEYKQNSIAALKKNLKLAYYTVEFAEMNTHSASGVISTEKDYAADETLAPVWEEAFAPIANATTKEEVAEAYPTVAIRLKEAYMQQVLPEAKANLEKLYSDWKATAQHQLDRWTSDTISCGGLYTGISADDSNDNRWWMPEPYKIPVVLGGIEEKLTSAKSIKEFNAFYAAYAYEILRTAMQRTMELYYAIERNLNKGYDTGDVLYWNVIAVYWGDTPAQAFTYNGILDKYVGEVYGSDSTNAFRLSIDLYKEGVAPTTIEGLIGKYNIAMTRLTPAPEAIESFALSAEPTTRIYELNDTISVAGAKVAVFTTYKNTIEIELTDEMWDSSLVDVTTVGTKTVSVNFEVLGVKKSVEISFLIVSDIDLLELIEMIMALPSAAQATEADIPAVMECIDTYNALTEEDRETFDADYQSEKDKLLSVQQKLMGMYTANGMSAVEVKFEQMNYYAYSEDNRAIIEDMVASLRQEVAKAESFAAAEELFERFETEFAAIEKISDAEADLNTQKANAKQSAERITEVEFYAIGGTLDDLSSTLQKVSLKAETGVKEVYDTFTAAIDGAADTAALDSVWEANASALHAAVVAKYREMALASVKGVVAGLRDTIKNVWEADGFEGTTDIPVDYMTDSWQYLWWTPVEFRVSTVYNKVAVKELASKRETFASYESQYIEMFRCTLYRNIYTVFQYKLSKGSPMEQYRWSILSAHCAAAGQNVYSYDGAIEEFKDVIINVEYRLWSWGFNPNAKARTVAGLLEKYNYDMDILLKA